MLYDLTNNIAECGDSLELMKRVPEKSVRLVLTDPPWNISNPGAWKTMRNHKVGTDFGAWDYGFDLLSWINVADKAVMPGGSIVTFAGFRKIGHVADHLESLGYDVKCPLALLKTNPVPRVRDRRFLATMEWAVWAVKIDKKQKWVFNRRPDKKFETGVFYAATQKSFHPTKKPNDMFNAFIQILSNPGDIVMDPFMGSGTTAVECKKLGRKYIVFEKDQGYFDQAMGLINEAN